MFLQFIVGFNILSFKNKYIVGTYTIYIFIYLTYYQKYVNIMLVVLFNYKLFKKICTYYIGTC